VSVQILVGDTRHVLSTLPPESVNCVVTSPPYWGLRDYGHDGQIGLEKTPEAYVSELVAVFREVRRVLRGDGTVWLNLGDSYGSGGMSNPSGSSTLIGGKDRGASGYSISRSVPPGLKPKDLVGIPWRVAFALQADGWYLRSDIIWAKPNPMPESVTDRPTKAHEYVFLLTKSARYWYDLEAVREPVSPFNEGAVSVAPHGEHVAEMGHRKQEIRRYAEIKGANARTVWTIATQPFSGAHFATMPPALAERCIKAGCPEGGTVLDPFGGAGTTGLVADRLGRNAVLIELNPAYADMARKRIADDAPLITEVA